MATTQLYVELIIIGLESAIGLYFVLINILGADKIKSLLTDLNTMPAIVIFVGIFYILGLIFDRFSDLVFQRWENRLRKRSGLQAKSVMLLLLKTNQYDFLMFTRNRIRIIRSTAINTIFILITALIYILKNVQAHRVSLIMFSLLFGLFIFIICILSYKQITMNYYNKTRVIELDSMGKEN